MKGGFNLNEFVVAEVRKSISQESSLISELTELLSLGKEAIYRRLRGEVPFTFEEVAKMSVRLGFSLDSIVGVKTDDRAVFSLDMLDLQDLDLNYTKRISKYVEVFRKMHNQTNIKACCTSNVLPYSMYFPFENLSRFFLYRWFYQVNKSQTSVPFSEVRLSEDALNAQRDFTTECENIRKVVFVLDREIFNFTIKDINYFFKLNLLTREELELLKGELLELLGGLEALAISGTHKNGSRVVLYLANVSLEASYSHFESDNMLLSHMRVLAINNLDSVNPKISKVQREWVDSLKRCSSLITQSGEVERFAFFNKQKAAVLAIGGD